MTLTFPTNPTIGQEFSGGGKAWAWTGAAWETVATSSGVTKTDEAGEVALSRYKSKEVAYIAASELPAGDYYITITLPGIASVYSYSGTSVNEKILDITSTSGRVSQKITVPSGVSGLLLRGSYLGPVIFQKITEASSVSNITDSFVEAGKILNIGNGNTWAKVDGSNDLLYQYTATGGNPKLWSESTGNTVTSSTFHSYTSGSTANYPGGMATNGSIIVTTTGYGGPSETSRIYSSSDGGATYVARHNIPGIDYNNRVHYGGGMFIVASRENGYGSAVTAYYTSPDGVTWTTRSLPRGLTSTYLRYANGLWVLLSRNSNSVYTSPDGVTWTQKAEPPFSNPSGIANVAGIDGKFFLTNNNGYWYHTSDFVTYTTLSNPGGYTGGGEQEHSSPRTSAVAYHNGYALFGGVNSSGYRTIYGWNASLSQISFFVHNGPGLSYPGNMAAYPFVMGSSLYAWTNNDPYDTHKITVNSSYSGGSLTGAPAVMPQQKHSDIVFSKKFNKWYMTNDQAGSLMVAQDAGRSSFLKWKTLVTSVNAGKIVETPNSIGFFSGTTYYRSTDGVNFTSKSLSQGVSGNAGAGYWKGIIAAGTGAARTVAVSFDDGLTFIYINVPFTAAESAQIVVLSDGIYAISSSNRQVMKSTDGVSFVSAGSNFYLSGTPELRAVNDCIIAYASGTAWYKTLPGGVMASIAFNVPYGSNGGSIVQFGSSFAYLPYTGTSSYYNAYWVSSDCLTWTQKTISSSKFWRYAYGSESHLFLSSDYDSSNRQIDVQSISTTLTF